MSAPLSTDRRSWSIEHRSITIGGIRRTLRLASFAAGWLASVDGPEGPTLAADRSPFLAAWRALEPLGVELVEALAVVGTFPRRDDRPQS